MFDQLRAAVSGLRAVVEGADPLLVTGEQSAVAVALFAEAERLACAGRTLFAKRVDETGAWAKSGHPSAASWMADQAGTTVGAAMGVLQTSWSLGDQPVLGEALRAGEISTTQANEVSEAAKVNPEAEQELVRAAKNTTVKALKERCNRAKAVTEGDREARQRARRSFRSWTERDGMLGFAGRLTPLDGAKFLAALDAETERIFREHRRAGEHEPRERYAADALVRLITGMGAGAAAVATVGGTATGEAGPPTSDTSTRGGRVKRARPRSRANVRIRVDLTALRRGHVEAGEDCEADRVGPVPVDHVRDLLKDPDTLIEAILTDGTNIVAVSRLDRYIGPRLRTALQTRDRTCVVPGCDRAGRLEIDHTTPFSQGGPTSFDNLAYTCDHHHDLKTRKKWRLARGQDGTWTFEPPPDPAAEPEPDRVTDRGPTLPGSDYVRWRCRKLKRAPAPA